METLMIPDNADQVIDQLRWRYAVKKFDTTRKLPAAAFQPLEDALVLAPSSYGIQPWKFWVVTDDAMKSSLVEHSWGQTQPRDCSHLVVLAVRKNLGETDINHYVERICAVRGVTPESLAGYRKMMLGTVSRMTPEACQEWSTRQVYIALGQLMATAAVLGIDTCPMEGIVNAKYDEILGIAAAGYETVVACPVGYRAADDAYSRTPKVRFPNAEVIVRL
jgi:nitroreductase